MTCLHIILIILYLLGGGGKFCEKKDVGAIFEEHPFEIKNDETDKNAYNHLTNEAHIDGLGCIDNKTLNFYALDMKTQTALANKIGLKIGVNEQHQEPKFVITSPNDEVVYEMTSNLNDPKRQLTLGQSISEFVSIFHNNPSQLAPLRISKNLNENLSRSNSHSDIPSNNDCDKHDSMSCVKEINGETFNRFILEDLRNKNVILLYKTASCAFCTAASTAAQVFHTVNRLFR